MKAMLAQDWDSDTSLREYAKDDTYCFEQKLDGHRVLLNIQSGIITAYNRNEKLSQHNPMMQEPRWRGNFKGLKGKHLILDGELIDEVYHVFDLIYLETVVDTQKPHRRRRDVLNHLFDLACFNEHITLVNTALTYKEKAKLTISCRDQGAEGIMIKNRYAPYVSGRSEYMLKVKFTKDIDAFVTRAHTDGKVNATLSVYNEYGEEVEIGRCSLIGREHIETGDVVEVRYLYVSDKMRLVQPRIKHQRFDKTPKDCLINQLEISNTKTMVRL